MRLGNATRDSSRQNGIVQQSFLARRPRFSAPASLLVALILAGGCAGSSGSGSSPTPTGSPLPLPALKLAVLDAIGGRLDYCDPDLFPVAHGTPLDAAEARFPMIQADGGSFDAILKHQHLSPTQHFTNDQIIAINDLYKQLQAIQLTATDGVYSFNVLVPRAGSDVGNQRLIGTVSRSGVVAISRRDPGQTLNCPICLVSGVRIATPLGDIRVQDIRDGMAVWTTDRKGHRIAGVVLKTGHMQAPLGHVVVRLQLTDGRSVMASPGHPTADGRSVGDLVVGDRLDGTTIAGVALLPYSGTTYDLLPSGPTGTYFADGMLLGSTLGGYGSAKT
jgi:hypothetical protein